MNASLTASNEALRLEAYDDKTGTPIIPGYIIGGNVTVGWGLCISKPYGALERDEADALLLYRLWKCDRALFIRFENWDEIGETRQSVLRDVAYNRGLSLFDMMGGLKTAVESEDWTLAAHIIASCPAAKVDVKRYARLQSLMIENTPLPVMESSPELSPEFLQFIREVN